MSEASTVTARVVAGGKFFRLGGQKFYVRGVTFGPFPPNSYGEPFPSPEQTVRDFVQLRDLGANVLRVYYVPPLWFLELARSQGLYLLVDVPWAKHRCFLESARTRAAARATVREAAKTCARHPAVFAISVVNEIPADLVRWSGAQAVADFIDELVGEVKAVAPECLCTFGNFPPTEFLRPKEIDFLTFNVYLHQRRPFENYLSRLQMIADAKPLLLGEMGIDSLREGEDRQTEILSWQLESAFRGGVAGAIVFGFTDDWFANQQRVTDWAFGLTTRERAPKPAFAAVQKQFQTAPFFPLQRYPKVSVVIACYNGDRTLKTCLDSLSRLNYPDYEVILVDDGSTDDTPLTAVLYPQVRFIRHTRNLGLSMARNTGISAAQGEIVAFTDADCRADEDWLRYLVGDLLRSRFAAIGGPNLLPPEDSLVATVVMASPGGPAHVMLTDREAEHIPGCNMAFYKWVLEELGLFDPIFKQAGDDVDLCWRLQERGYQIGFSPAGFVWHYRRSTVRHYLDQQRGYGDAEALLVHKHPEYFNWFGGGLWQGRIYSPAKIAPVFRRPRIYHGLFGSGMFQSLYAGKPTLDLLLFTSLEYHILVTLPLVLVAISFHFMAPLALTSLLVSLLVCATAAIQAELPKDKTRLWSRPMVALLFLLQPLFRGLARYHGRLTLRPRPLASRETMDTLTRKGQGQRFDEVHYWAEPPMDRVRFLTGIMQHLEEEEWPYRTDVGWNDFDVELVGGRWIRLYLTTVHDGKNTVRCRLKPAWTLPAQIAFVLMFALEMTVAGFFSSGRSWLWLMLLSLPILAWWWLRRQQRHLQRIFAVFLDEVAATLHLTRIPQTITEQATSVEPEARGET